MLMGKNIVVVETAVKTIAESTGTPAQRILLEGLTQEEKNLLFAALSNQVSASVKKDVAVKAQSEAEKAAEEFNALIKSAGNRALSSINNDIDRIGALAHLFLSSKKETKTVKFGKDVVIEIGPNKPIRIGIKFEFDIEPPKKALKALGGDLMFRRKLSEAARKNDAVIAEMMKADQE